MEERDPRTYAIIGAAMAVHREQGSGFLEPVYHESIEFEFLDRRVPYVHEAQIPIHYKQHPLKTVYRADFLCYDEVIVELKVIPAITRNERAQILHYLKAAKKKVGLLINFGGESLEWERFVL